ncbi:MAG TPA: ATP-binding protein [Candidatus Saccharimonadales bacterium]|nr:ATP-binding protein [Candidatus Saccharimonadales bacterium]
MMEGSEGARFENNWEQTQVKIDGELLGVVIGVTKPGYITFEGKEPIGLGEYISITNGQRKSILGVVESCFIKSDALDEISNFEEALESKIVAEINKRDKSYKVNVKILGLQEMLKNSKSILPEIPPLPGTEVYRARKDDLKDIFDSEEESWIKIGTLLRNTNVNVRVNTNKMTTRHLGILAMTGMGKSNLVSVIAKSIAEIPGTMVIFDYHDEYRFLQGENINFVQAQINPRLLTSDKFGEVIEIRENADIQNTILLKAFDNDDLKKKIGDDFWDELEKNIKDIGIREKRFSSSADRVTDKIKEARRRFDNILIPNAADPVSQIKEGCINIINLIEFTEKQANVAIAFYLESILYQRKLSKGQSLNSSYQIKNQVLFHSPVIVVIEEAHVFMPKNESTDTKYIASKVAREGRKFGVGLIIVSQRPRTLDPNVLSQMGSLAIMKLVQQEDQSQIESSSESINGKIIEQLPSLNPGEALLVGQWVNLPSFIKIDEILERTMGKDPEPVNEWKNTKEKRSMSIEDSRTYIREDYIEEEYIE